MKLNTGLLILIIYLVVLMLTAVLFGGCSLFQMSPADKIAALPETPQQQLFQTLAKTNWLLALSVLGFGAGFFAFLNGSSKGLQFMAACLVVISLIIGITRYSAVIAMISMIGAVCLMVYTILVKNKAVKEIISGVESVKLGGAGMTVSGPVLESNVNDRMAEYQSKTTKAIVKAVKTKL